MAGSFWKLTRFKLLVLVTLAVWLGGQEIGHRLREAQDSPPPPARVGSPAWFMEEYDCWGSDETAPVAIPGHAVVMINGRDPQLVGPRLTGHALEHVFHDRYPNLQVVAFCR